MRYYYNHLIDFNSFNSHNHTQNNLFHLLSLPLYFNSDHNTQNNLFYLSSFLLILMWFDRKFWQFLIHLRMNNIQTNDCYKFSSILHKIQRNNMCQIHHCVLDNMNSIWWPELFVSFIDMVVVVLDWNELTWCWTVTFPFNEQSMMSWEFNCKNIVSILFPFFTMFPFLFPFMFPLLFPFLFPFFWTMFPFCPVPTSIITELKCKLLRFSFVWKIECTPSFFFKGSKKADRECGSLCMEKQICDVIRLSHKSVVHFFSF